MEDVGRRTFRIETCLGRGGFGEVYKALMSSPGGLQSEVAVKVLRGDLDPVGQAVQRLRDEGRLLARLDHPTILRVHDLVLLDGRISLVTEFVDGQDLGDLCHGDDPLPVRALVEVIGAVAGALHAAWSAPLGPDGHTLQIVHRDIKPSNVRISRHGQVKLLDFGIARTDTVDREARTQTNLMVGSPAYMAPERFTSNDVVPASDVFALGCALYEGLADGDRLLGEITLPMLSALALDDGRYAAHLERKLVGVRSRGPASVVALMESMLAWDPLARPSAAEVRHACEELADEVPGRSLARYCRERAWPRGAADVGQLDGRVITEGTLLRSREISPVGSADAITERAMASLPPTVSSESLVTSRPSAPPRRGLGLAIAGGGALVAGLAGVAVVAVGVVLWSAGVFSPTPEPAVEGLVADADVPPVDEGAPIDEARVDEAPIDETPIDEAPIDEAPVDEAPPIAPSPVPLAPEPRPVAVAGPRPVTPQPPTLVPVPAPVAAPLVPQPAAAAVKKARIEVTGGVAVEFRRDDEKWSAPGDVPAGTWNVFGQFNGRDWASAGTMTLEAGQTWRLDCNTSFMRCGRKLIAP